MYMYVHSYMSGGQMCLLASLLYASVYIFIFLFPTNFISVMIARVTDNLYSFFVCREPSKRKLLISMGNFCNHTGFHFE